MREVSWTKLERNKKYMIESVYTYSGLSNRKIGNFQYIHHRDNITPFLWFNSLENLPCDTLLPSSLGLSIVNDFSGLCHKFYEFPLQYLHNIQEYTPKKIPSLHSLVKYQLSTEEIRIAREYDGMF
jgi:hypothetical protein